MALPEIDVHLLIKDAAWVAELDRLYAALGSPHNPLLLPRHFTEVVLPKLGGKIAIFRTGAQLIGAGFLFPRARPHALQNTSACPAAYTLRYHASKDAPACPPAALIRPLEALLPECQIVYYDPRAAHSYVATHEEVGTLDIGRPSAAELAAMRLAHQQIWGSPPESLYPTDLHSMEFGLGTSLVARVENAVAGFLFGFYRLNGSTLPTDWAQRFHGNWRIESQAMGVLPAYRGQRIAYLLKWKQAQLAQKAGVDIINWTADPLQFANAALNLGLLKAISFDFYPDLYPFRNELNQAPASRLGLTWLLKTPRVAALSPQSAQAAMLQLDAAPEVQRINQGTRQVADASAQTIAIEIPADWTTLQRESPDEALDWRSATDQLFAQYLGHGANQYVLTGVGVEQQKRFLIAERAGEALWQRISEDATLNH